MGEICPRGRDGSDYIYRHLQEVLGASLASEAPAADRPDAGSDGRLVLMTFNKHYRARDFIHFLESTVPGLELAHRSSGLGQHEVVLLYADDVERVAALTAIQKFGVPTPALEI